MRVDQVRGVLIPSTHEIRVKAVGGKIGVLVDGKPAETLSTVETHRNGFDMIRLADKCHDGFIRIRINGKPIDVTGELAKKIGAALLRKADQADDFQLNQKVKV